MEGHSCMLSRPSHFNRDVCISFRNERQSEEFTTLLKEKDDQIAQLLEEGKF